MNKALIIPYEYYNPHTDASYLFKYLGEPIFIPAVPTDA